MGSGAFWIPDDVDHRAERIETVVAAVARALHASTEVVDVGGREACR